MRSLILPMTLFSVVAVVCQAGEPPVVAKPDAFKTLVNPACSHCKDEAKRRAVELKPNDRILAWTRGYSDGGAIPIRFFLSPYRVISDSYGVFVYDPEAGYSRGFAASYEFEFHGWRNGVMVMKHKDGTLFSCLTGLAFEGPQKGTRLTAVPTVVSDWGPWIERYPNAVAYHMFDEYQPVEFTAKENPDSVKSRGKADDRLKLNEQILGVWTGKIARAYTIQDLENSGILEETVDGASLVVLWEPKTRTASAYRPFAQQPRKSKAPAPDKTGVSKPNAGTILPEGAREIAPRKLTLGLATNASAPGRFQDSETMSHWDVAGRCVEGELKGYTLEWVESVQVKWFAWFAEYPETEIAKPKAAESDKNVKAIAGTAEFLRLLPKPFATVKGIDIKANTVSLLIDGEKEAKTWSLEPDTEVKLGGWWGRLEQFQPGDRVWVWLKLDRKKNPVSVAMIADEISEYDMHGSLREKPTEKPKIAAEEIEKARSGQKEWLRKHWIADGLPGSLTFHHVFSGELEVTLEHEAMRWGRSLKAGDTVQLVADPPIKAVVKAVTPRRERTSILLVVGELESSELKLGQRIALKMTPPSDAVEKSIYPPDIGRERTKAERIEWFLASTYCTCGVSKDICTGHYYTLACCNPNGCGMPNFRRDELAKLIDQGKTDRQIFDELLKDAGPLLLRPHLKP